MVLKGTFNHNYKYLQQCNCVLFFFAQPQWTSVFGGSNDINLFFYCVIRWLKVRFSYSKIRLNAIFFAIYHHLLLIIEQFGVLFTKMSALSVMYWPFYAPVLQKRMFYVCIYFCYLNTVCQYSHIHNLLIYQTLSD